MGRRGGPGPGHVNFRRGWVPRSAWARGGGRAHWPHRLPPFSLPPSSSLRIRPRLALQPSRNPLPAVGPPCASREKAWRWCWNLSCARRPGGAGLTTLPMAPRALRVEASFLGLRGGPLGSLGILTPAAWLLRGLSHLGALLAPLPEVAGRRDVMWQEEAHPQGGPRPGPFMGMVRLSVRPRRNLCSSQQSEGWRSQGVSLATLVRALAKPGLKSSLCPSPPHTLREYGLNQVFMSSSDILWPPIFWGGRVDMRGSHSFLSSFLSLSHFPSQCFAPAACLSAPATPLNPLQPCCRPLHFAETDSLKVLFPNTAFVHLVHLPGKGAPVCMHPLCSLLCCDFWGTPPSWLCSYFSIFLLFF